MKKYILFLIPLIIISNLSPGQEIAPLAMVTEASINTYMPSIGSPSPTAYKFSTYGNIPMESNSGAFNYSLPLYIIKSHDIELPVSLDYHSSGIKIDELSSIAGTDWNLNAGGIISRVMRGKPDERSDRWYPNSSIQPGKEYEKILQVTGAGTSQGNMKDTEPDWFSFNVNGISGNFYLDQNLNIQLQSKEAIRLTYKKISEGIGFGPVWEFTLIDSKGYKYILGGSDEYLESNDGFSNCDPIPRPLSYYSSWYLKEIISPAQNKINFRYISNNLAYYTGVSYNITLTEPCYCPDDSQSMIYSESECTSFNDLQSKILSRIDFENNSLVFEYNTDRKDKGGVSIKNIIVKYQNEIIKKINFAYDMVESSKGRFTPRLQNQPSLNYRLFLKEVAFYGNNSLSEKYSFEYYDKEKLPSRLSLAKDIYGYYNGADNNSSPYSSEIKKDREIFYLIRPYGGDSKLTADQNPNPSTAHYGMLKKIIYPTGGYTEIIYEPNSTLEKNKITYYENHSINITKACNETGTKEQKFTFVSNGTPINFNAWAISDNYQNSCTPVSDPLHDKFDFSIRDLTTGKLLVSAGRKYSENFTSDTFLDCDRDNKNSGNSYPEKIYPICTQQGHTYEIILSLLSKPFNPAYGGASIKYNSYDTWEDTPAYKAGVRIKEISDYTDNQQYNRRKFFYNKLSAYPSGFTTLNSFYNPVYLKKSTMIAFCRYNCCADIPIGPDFYSCVNQSEAINRDTKLKYELSSSSLTSLFDNRSSAISYTHITEFLETNDKQNGIIEKEYIRNDDIPSSNLLPPEIYNSPYSNRGIGTNGLLNAEKIYNNTKKLVASKNYLYNSLKSQIYYSYIVHKNYTLSDFFTSGSLKNSLVNISIQEYRNHIKNAKIRQTIDSTFLSNNVIVSTTNYTYDNEPYFNLKTQSSGTSTGELITRYQYPPDLTSGNSLMQELVSLNRISTPVTTETLRKENGAEKQLSFSQTEYSKDAATSQLILPKFVYAKKGEAVLEKKITYDKYDSKGNLLQYTPENGIPVSIIWGYNQLYPIAKIEGAAYSEVESKVSNLQNLSNALNEAGLLSAFQQLRNQLPSAMVTTYTYKPLVGITSLTSPNGLTEYYEYDDFGRLKQIKDMNGKLVKSFEYHYKSQN